MGCCMHLFVLALAGGAAQCGIIGAVERIECRSCAAEDQVHNCPVSAVAAVVVQTAAVVCTVVAVVVHTVVAVVEHTVVVTVVVTVEGVAERVAEADMVQ